jgi:hypothetical protein
MAYSILIPGAIMANNVDSLVKNAKYTAGAVENGNVITLGALSSTSGESEVYLAATPETSTLATDIFYMVYEPVSVLTDSKYRGLNDDPTNFNIAASTVFNCFKPKVGDEIIISEDGLAGSKSSNTYVIPANDTLELTWASSYSSVSLAWELIETTSIKVPSSTFYSASTTAYKFRCIKA